MNKNTFYIQCFLYILLLFTACLSVGCIDQQTSDDIDNDVFASNLKDTNSSKDIGFINTIALDGIHGKLSIAESLIYNDNDPGFEPRSGHIPEYDAMLAAIKIMQAVEKYPQIKTVVIDVNSNDPSMLKIVHLETRTGQGIDWSIETPTAGDPKGYSKQKFDTTNWFENTVK